MTRFLEIEASFDQSDTAHLQR